MKGIFINCPSCRKMLFKDAYIRLGTYFTGMCAQCGNIIKLKTESGRIILKIETKIEADDNDDEVIFMSS